MAAAGRLRAGASWSECRAAIRRGVPREFWEDALEEREPDGDQVLKLARQKLRGAEPTRENLKRVSDYLARRGYGWDEISGALDRLREEEWE